MSGSSSTVSTSIPDIVFGPAGIIAPLESAVLAGAQQDINAAMGGGANPDLRTPQGQLAQSQTAVVGDKNAQFLALAASIDPAYASGRGQDGIGRVYFIDRNPALPTVASACICVGAAGTLLASGVALAQDPEGNLYTPVADATIGAGGTVTVDFICTVTGPIPCPARSLSFYNVINGWDTISNPSDGILGVLVESRSAFEFRRNLAVAKNAAGTLPAIQGAVITVPNVIDAVVRDNSTNSDIVIGGVTIAKNSLYVCVSGGDPQAVATAIWTKKQPGCSYTGSTSETVQDTSNYAPPYPSYTVKFDQSSDVPIFWKVSIINSTSIPEDALTQIQNAILAAFSGSDNGLRARLGAELLASRYYPGIINLGSWAQVVSVFIGIAANPTGTILQLNLNQQPTFNPADIALVLV